VETATPIWSVKASIVEDRAFGPLGLERRRGSKHLRAGAKVWAIDAFWGEGGEQVTVIGRHRASLRYSRLVVPAHHVTAFRPQLIYSPTVLALVAEHFVHNPWPGTQEAAANLATNLAAVAEKMRERPAAPRLFQVMGIHAAKALRLRELSADGELGQILDIPLELTAPAMREVGTTLRWIRGEDGPNRLEIVGP
jgi:hypothetical protein